MKRKAGNYLVLLYLVFILLLLIEIIFHNLQKTNSVQAEKMEFDINESDDVTISSKDVELSRLNSRPRMIEEGEIVREPVWKLTETDEEALLRIVEAEAGCEDDNGKLLVANVVLNRVKSGKFPGNVRDVVFQATDGKVQFTPAYNGRYSSVKISEGTRDAVERAVYGEDISQGALYFVAGGVAGAEKTQWFYEHLTFLFQYGGHSFFK